jgi:hypothetical protein
MASEICRFTDRQREEFSGTGVLPNFMKMPLARERAVKAAPYFPSSTRTELPLAAGTAGMNPAARMAWGELPG